ncbi:MAG: M20/M25/M40 family metallo-hydrolase [Pseudomonadota bacterium]
MRCILVTLGVYCLALSSVGQADRAESPVIAPDEIAMARSLMQQAQADNPAFALVSSLTTEVGPRLAGSEAESRARQWAMKKLRGMGFANVREEFFSVPLWRRGAERVAITQPFPQPLTVTTLGGSASTGPDGVEGEVVSVPTLAALEALAEGSLKGKILFVDESTSRSRDGAGYGAAVGKRRHAAYLAEQRGALAVLIRSVGTSSDRFAHAGQMRRITESGSPGVPAAALTGPDADQLARVLAYGDPVRVRVVLTPETLAPVPSGNVVAEIVGQDAPEDIVLVGAHLDSWDLGTGALDDGAGIGIVVSAAKHILDHAPQPPRRTIRVVLFGAEEVGLVGARAYADAYEDSLPQHIVATESDFGAENIWRFDTRVGAQGQAFMDQLAGLLSELGIERGNNEARGGPDITFLREAGVPVIGLVQEGTDYFDLHHTANDTLDKIAPGALSQNVAAYVAFLYLTANSDINLR